MMQYFCSPSFSMTRRCSEPCTEQTSIRLLGYRFQPKKYRKSVSLHFLMLCDYVLPASLRKDMLMLLGVIPGKVPLARAPCQKLGKDGGGECQ